MSTAYVLAAFTTVICLSNQEILMEHQPCARKVFIWQGCDLNGGRGQNPDLTAPAVHSGGKKRRQNPRCRSARNGRHTARKSYSSSGLLVSGKGLLKCSAWVLFHVQRVPEKPCPAPTDVCLNPFLPFCPLNRSWSTQPAWTSCGESRPKRRSTR